MTEDRKEILSNYVSSIVIGNFPSVTIGKRIKYVCRFLEEADTINKKGYRKFVKEHIQEIAVENGYCDAICDLLNKMGIGYSRKKRTVNVKSLEKIQTLCDKNRNIIDNFLLDLKDNNDYSDNTFRVYYQCVSNFFKYSSEVNKDSIKRFIRTLEEKKYSARTINLHITALEKLCNFLKKPINVKRPKIQRKLYLDNIPSEKDYNLILDYLRKNDYRWYLNIRLLATTGARVSEFLKLTFEDVERGYLDLKSKGGKYRRIYFSKTLQKEIKVYSMKNHLSGIIAIGKYGKLTTRGVAMKIHNIGDKCGIDASKMHPHAFRHFFAKMYLKNNKDIVELANILGHESVDTTRLYLQKTNDEQQKNFNRSVTW